MVDVCWRCPGNSWICVFANAFAFGMNIRMVLMNMYENLSTWYTDVGIHVETHACTLRYTHEFANTQKHIYHK